MTPERRGLPPGRASRALIALICGAAAWACAEGPPSLPPGIGFDRLLAAREDSADWMMDSGSFEAWRSSRLRQVDTASVSRLGRAWVRAVSVEAPMEATPLVVDGRMFVTEPPGHIVALDAASGETLWEFRPEIAPRPTLCCGRVNRGVALLGTTLYMGTVDGRLLAVDAATGTLRWERPVADPALGFGITSVPLVVKDMVVTGVSLDGVGLLLGLGERRPEDYQGVVVALDAETGAERWRHHVVPEGDEVASWPPGFERLAWASTWATGTYDPELDRIYWGVGAPVFAFFDLIPEGDLVPTNSVIALDPDTGERVWTFQFTPHGTHDWDAAHKFVLADGSTGPTLLNANRNGFFYTLDRTTGRLLRAAPYALQTWAEGVDELGRPRAAPGLEPTAEGTRLSPTADGATSWWMPAYDPVTGLYIVTTNDGVETYRNPAPGLRGGDAGETLARLGSVTMDDIAEWRAVLGWPRGVDLTRLSSAVRAIRPETGEVAWEHPLPGRSTGGILTTEGGLVFVGTNTGRLRALDVRTGAMLWEGEALGHVHAAPVTYMVDGAQYIAVASNGGLTAFRLARP